MDCSLPGSSVHENFQARILDWVAIPFFRGFSQPRNQTWASCTAGGFFTIWVTREALRTQGIPHFLPDNVNFSFKNMKPDMIDLRAPLIYPLLAELEFPSLSCHTPFAWFCGGTYNDVLLTNAAFSLPSWWVIWWKNLDFISFPVPSTVAAAEWVFIVTVCVLEMCKRRGVGVVRGIWRSRRGEERRSWREGKWRREKRRKRRKSVKNGRVLWNLCEMNLVPYSINYLDPTSFPNKGSIGGVLDPQVWASTHIFYPTALKIYEYSPFLSDGPSSEWLQVLGANLRNPPDILVMLLQGPTFGTSDSYIWCYWVWGLVATWRPIKGIVTSLGLVVWAFFSFIIDFFQLCIPGSICVGYSYLFPQTPLAMPKGPWKQAPPAFHFNLAD